MVEKWRMLCITLWDAYMWGVGWGRFMLPMMLQESEARRLTTFFPFDLNTRIRRATLTQTTIVDPKRNTCLFVLYISMIISVFIFLLYFFVSGPSWAGESTGCTLSVALRDSSRGESRRGELAVLLRSLPSSCIWSLVGLVLVFDISLSVPDPDLEIRGGRSSRRWDRGEGAVLRTSVWSKNKRRGWAPLAPPLDPPLSVLDFIFSWLLCPGEGKRRELYWSCKSVPEGWSAR